MAGPRSPVLLRHLDKVVGFLVPHTKVSFLVPVPRSSFWFLVPRSGSSFRFLVPRSGSSFLVPVPRSLFRFLVPRSGSNLQIYHTLPSLLTLGIIYTIILLNIGPGNAGPKTRNSLNMTSTGGGGGTETPENHYHAQGTVYGLPGMSVLPVVCAFSFW